MKTLLACLLLFPIVALGQKPQYFKVIDADNDALIHGCKVETAEKDVKILYQENGFVEIQNLADTKKVIFIAENYSRNQYTQPKNTSRSLMKNEAEQDTVTIELVLNDELLAKRWKTEDSLYGPIEALKGIEAEMPETIARHENLEEFNRIMSAGLYYPEHIREEGISGKVYIMFIVETDGSITNVRIARGVLPEFDRIALRALRNPDLPKLVPSMRNGIPSRSYVVKPVNFELY